MDLEEDDRPVRAADVARMAGVSPATVSLVVNDKADGRISAATQERVRAAVEQLGYRVDRGASGLAGGRAGVVSLLVPDLDSPFFAHVTMGVHETLGADIDLSLVISGHHPARLGRSIERVLSSRIDGLLLDGVGAILLRGREAALPFPVVVMDDPDDRVALPSVDFALQAGATALADHLVELGHQRLAYLATEIDAPTFRLRERYLSTSLARGVGKDAPMVRLRSDTTADGARQVVTEAWPSLRDRGITALVCATDVQAYGALHAVLELGVDVPGQLSLASFDDLPMAKVVTPSLTAVALPARELARVATTSLLEAVTDGTTPDPQRWVESRLVVRQSTGPAVG